MMIKLSPIGFVKNDFIAPPRQVARGDSEESLQTRLRREGKPRKGPDGKSGSRPERRGRSKIILLPKYTQGLYRIKGHKYIEVIFYFNRSKGYTPSTGGREVPLKCKTPSWGIRGVFACRSPRRPAPLGLTKVRLISVRKNELIVEGLDAFNNTPVLDIKPAIDKIRR